MPRAVFFDLGGVLLFYDHREICARLGRRAGLSSDEVHRRLFASGLEEAYDTGAIGDAEFHRQVCAALGVAIPFAHFARDWGDIFWPNTPMIRLLAQVRGVCRTAIISNTNPLHIEHARVHLDVDAAADVAVLSYRLRTRKPDARMWEAALTATGVAPADAFYIDDRADYVDAARRLGIPGCVYTDAAELARRVNFAAGLRCTPRVASST